MEPTDACIARRGEFVSSFALTFKASIHIDANAVTAHSYFTALVVIRAIISIRWQVKSLWAYADEASWCVCATTILAFSFAAFVNICKQVKFAHYLSKELISRFYLHIFVDVLCCEILVYRRIHIHQACRYTRPPRKCEGAECIRLRWCFQEVWDLRFLQEEVSWVWKERINVDVPLQFFTCIEDINHIY